MENVLIKTEGTKLVITIDASADLGLSKSGKTRMVASTQGNKAVTDQPARNKVQRDADRDRKTQDVQEQLRNIAH